MTDKKTTRNVCQQLKRMTMTFSLLLGVSSAPLPAHALQCGDTIGPHETVVLDGHLGPCDASTGGIIIQGPATLDLNNFTFLCDGSTGDGSVKGGITLEGKRAQLRNGVVRNCLDGVVVAGQGRHRIKDVVAVGNTGSGFHVISDNNTLQRNTALLNGDGFFVGSNRNKLTQNNAHHNQGAGYRVGNFATRFVANMLRKNTATDNGFTGFLLLTVERTTLAYNIAARNELSGFFIVAERSRLTANTATANQGPGFLVAGRAHRLVKNRAEDNDGVGIHLAIFDTPGGFLQAPAEDILVTKSVAHGNGTFDLQDDNVECGTNRWRRNEFDTANPLSCIE